MPRNDGVWMKTLNQIQACGYLLQRVRALQFREDQAEADFPQSVRRNEHFVLRTKKRARRRKRSIAGVWSRPDALPDTGY